MAYSDKALVSRRQDGSARAAAGKRKVARRIGLAMVAAGAAQALIALMDPAPALAADAVTINGKQQVYCYWSAAAGAVRKHAKATPGVTLADVTWEVLPADSPDSKKCAQERAKRALERLKKRAGVQ